MSSPDWQVSRMVRTASWSGRLVEVVPSRRPPGGLSGRTGTASLAPSVPTVERLRPRTSLIGLRQVDGMALTPVWSEARRAILCR